MDVVVANKVEALKNEKMGPLGPCSSRSDSQYSMSRTCGPRDIISLVIPRLGDNKVLDISRAHIVSFMGAFVEGVLHPFICNATFFQALYFPLIFLWFEH